ncbi:MAG TPA: hypothetical protein VLE93_01800 [Candidatus Saccharimonadales bacterium]|nr:hypothetical protein [Candidatus Saccharimonadales bacterium]
MKRISTKFFLAAIGVFVLWSLLGPIATNNDPYVVLAWPNPLFVGSLVLGLLGFIALQNETQQQLNVERCRQNKLEEKLQPLDDEVAESVLWARTRQALGI